MSLNGAINILPNDCLFRVFSYLSVEDRLRVHGVCKRWRDLGPFIWKDMKKLDLTQLTKLKTQHSRIVSLCENALQDLSVSVYDESDVLDAAADCCENLKKIKVTFYSFCKTEGQYQQLNKLFKNSRKIRSVVLEDVQIEFLANVSCLSELSVELEALELWGFNSCKKGACNAVLMYQPCDEFLARFVNLRHLVLTGFIIRKDDFKAIERMKELRALEVYKDYESSDLNIGPIAKLTKLEYLFLHNAKNTTGEWCAELVKNNQNLRHLKFSVCTFDSQAMQEFGKLPLLEILELRHLDNGFFTADDFKRFYSLKKFDCNIVKDEWVIPLLENSPNLEFMNVSSTLFRHFTPRVLDVAHRVTSCRVDTPLHIILDDDVVDSWRKPVDVSPLLKIEKATAHIERFKKVLPANLWQHRIAFYVCAEKNLIEMQ